MGGNRVSVLETRRDAGRARGHGREGLRGRRRARRRRRSFNGPHHLLMGPDGALYVADTWNNCVRRIDLKTGVVTRVAGTGEKGFDGDGGPARRGPLRRHLRDRLPAGRALRLRPRQPAHPGRRPQDRDRDHRRGQRREGRAAGRRRRPHAAARRPAGDRARFPGQPLYLRARRPRPAGGRSRGQDPHRGGDRRGGLLRRRGPGARRPGSTAPSTSRSTTRGACSSRTPRTTSSASTRRPTARSGAWSGRARKAPRGLGGPPESCQLNRPHGAMRHPATGDLYISDSENHRVIRVEKR